MPKQVRLRKTFVTLCCLLRAALVAPVVMLSSKSVCIAFKYSCIASSYLMRLRAWCEKFCPNSHGVISDGCDGGVKKNKLAEKNYGK